MKLRTVTALALIVPFLALPVVAQTNGASTGANPKAPKAKPDLLTTCPVSGDKLGEMGKPFLFIYKGQEVKLCCKNCKPDFDKDPAKYIKKIEAAAKQPAPTADRK